MTLQPKQFNIATGPQGTRWSDDMIAEDERWKNQSERDLGKAYIDDVAKTQYGKSSHYYPGQGGPGTQSQGKLFHDPKPVDAHRWPRGFTPERKSDVDATFSRTGNVQKNKVGNLAKGAIARSSMPEEDLTLLRGGEEGTKTVGLGASYMGGYARWAGTYHSPGSRDTYGASGDISLAPNASAHTVLHETGHAVSQARGLPGIGPDGTTRLGRSWHGTPGNVFPEMAGAEEARADIYAADYARKRDGTPHPRGRNYDPSAYDLDRADGTRRFRDAYEQEHSRQGKPTPNEVRQKEEKEEKEERAKATATNLGRQAHLFQRPGKFERGFPGSPDYLPMPTEPDHGQWGAQSPEGADLGTISVGGGLPKPIQQAKIRRERQIARVADLRRKRLRGQ